MQVRHWPRFWIGQAPQTSKPEHTPARTIWAKQPWRGRLGRYVALRLKDGKLEVGIAGTPLHWVPAERAISEHEAERWARIGFD